MSTFRMDLSFRQGETVDLTIPVETGSDPAAAFDFTGYTVRSQIRRSYGGRLVLDLAGRLTVLGDATEGNLRLLIPADVTETLPVPGGTAVAPSATYVWDAEAESAGGVVVALWEGTVTIYAEVTT